MAVAPYPVICLVLIQRKGHYKYMYLLGSGRSKILINMNPFPVIMNDLGSTSDFIRKLKSVNIPHVLKTEWKGNGNTEGFSKSRNLTGVRLTRRSEGIVAD